MSLVPRCRRAQAMVETALVMTIFCVVALGLMQVAWWFMEDHKLRTALDLAASRANASVHEEYVALHCTACPRVGEVLLIRLPTGARSGDYLPQTTQTAQRAARELIEATGLKQNVTVGVSYSFADGRGDIHVTATFDSPGLIRMWPFPDYTHFAASATRRLEIVGR